MKTIAVIGGTGMLGAPVARQLQQQGYTVRIINRDSAKAKKMLGDNFQYAEADIFDPERLKIALQGCQGIHINLTGNSAQSYFKNHVTGTENIISAVKGSQIKLISMISTASAYPENDFRHDTKYKLQAEQLLKDSGIAYLVFLPSWFMETLALFEQNGKIVQIGKSSQKIHWQSAAEYAEIVAQAYADKEQYNRRITIFGPQGLTMTQALQNYAQHHNLKMQSMSIFMAKFFAWITRDQDLRDAADLLQYYERVGEKTVADTVRTQTDLQQWLLQ
ncbi:MAG: hypothetical protein OFPI_36730 [Osedax symbiont Rs2]|nr:MAG: hypothetical protein OFPI_36730 [Osedax symbiont Rs2]